MDKKLLAESLINKPIETIKDEDGYIAIKFSEYKELLITKGKYEELKAKEDTIQYIPYTPNIQPLTTPYPADLTPKYPNVTLCNIGREKDGTLRDLDKISATTNLKQS